MKEIKISKNSPYGEHQDLLLTNVTVRYSPKNEIRIFFGNGIPPVFVPKDSAMYKQLMKQFKLKEEK
jgi:hypothetical protein